MQKNVTIELKNHKIELISNGAEEFDNVVVCFHGFNGDKWGDAYSGLKRRAENSLVCSFDSCGHGTSEVASDKMRLNEILDEINAVLKIIKKEVPNKSIILVAVSYGAYRVMHYLYKYKPDIQKVIYINPAFRMLEILQFTKNFKYSELQENQLVSMKRSLNKFMHKSFLDDLHHNNLYQLEERVNYDTDVFVGTRDTLIPLDDTLEIVKKHKYNLFFVEDEHCFMEKENWLKVAERIKGIR